MRITYFTDTFRIGGAERFLAGLAAGVADAGNHVTVVSPQASVLEFLSSEAPSVETIQTKTNAWVRPSRPRRMGAFARALVELPVAFRQSRPDLLHVNNGGYPGSELCRAAVAGARLGGRPRCVLSVHSAPLPRDRSKHL